MARSSRCSMSLLLSRSSSFFLLLGRHNKITSYNLTHSKKLQMIGTVLVLFYYVKLSHHSQPTITPGSCAVSRALGWLHALALSSNRLLMIFSFFLIGCSYHSDISFRYFVVMRPVSNQRSPITHEKASPLGA